MKTADGLQRRWSERSRYALGSQIAITSEGLVLGGTILAKMARNKDGAPVLSLNDEPRIMAVLATAYEQPIV